MDEPFTRGRVIASPRVHARSLGVRDAREGMDGTMEVESAQMREALLNVAAELEARLDHPDDDLSPSPTGQWWIPFTAMVS